MAQKTPRAPSTQRRLREIDERLNGIDKRLDRTDDEIATMARAMRNLVTESTAQMLLKAFDGMTKRLSDTAQGLVVVGQRHEALAKQIDTLLRDRES